MQAKQQIIGAIQSTDRFSGEGEPRIKADTRKKFQRATAALVADGILTGSERDEVARLVDVRNEIAHNIHDLTYDVSRDTYARQRLEFDRSKYDYGALKRVRHFQVELSKRMMSKYVHLASMDGILFNSAEKTYEAELKRLDKKIRVQIAARQRKSGILKKELSLGGTEFDNEDLYPAHPRNMARNGNLSRRGVEVCFRLFDIGKRPIVVAYLMYISAKAARHRHAQWIRVGGVNRRRIEIAPLSTPKRER